MLVYTDASAVGDQVRIGALAIAPGVAPQALIYDVPEEVRALWGTGDVVINQAELHAGPLVATSMPEILRQREVIWFIDNSAAETSMVKAGSPTATMCTLALVCTAALAGLGARTWFEHVPSADNPADPLSRKGKEDAWVGPKIRSGEWKLRDPVEPEWERGLDYAYWWQRTADQ